MPSREGPLNSDPLTKLGLGESSPGGFAHLQHFRNGLDTQSIRTNENSTDGLAEPERVWNVHLKICHSGIRSILS